MSIPTRRARHHPIEDLAQKHIYAPARDVQYLRQMQRYYGHKATIKAIEQAREVQKILNPTFEKQYR